MKSNLVLIIFLIIWVGIAGYLFLIDSQLKKIKQKLLFQRDETDSL
jgi:CcmD family protein